MSQTRRTASLIAFLAVVLILGWQQSATSVATETRGGDIEPLLLNANGPDETSLTLIEAASCEELCFDNCDGDCLDWRPVGCSCFWVCGNGEEGSHICAGAIGVSICTN